MPPKIHLFILLTILLVTGCRPNITISNNSTDTDLSPFHPETVQGAGFTIQPDVRVFTLYAYLNGPAGWSEENGESFSPQRTQLRSDIQKQMEEIDPAVVKRWRDFYQNHQVIPYRYLYYTLTLGAPPDFNHIVPVEQLAYPEIVSSLQGFNEVLSDFYQQTNLQALFENTYREVMMDEVRKYDEQHIVAQIANMYAYLRLDRAQYETFDLVIVPAPFNSYWDAYAINYTTQLYIVEGLESNDYGLNVHEYLHMLMDKLIPEDFAGQRSKLNKIYQANRKAPYVKSYQNLHIYVEENLVRALDHRMRVEMDPLRKQIEERVMQDEVQNGLVLIDNFYQVLEQYEQNPGQSASKFFKQMLVDVSE